MEILKKIKKELVDFVINFRTGYYAGKKATIEYQRNISLGMSKSQAAAEYQKSFLVYMDEYTEYLKGC